MRKTATIFSKSVLITIVIIALAACGDSSGGSSGGRDSRTGFHFTCINVVNDVTVDCSSVVEDAGDLSESTAIHAAWRTVNDTDGDKKYYTRGTVIFNGCAPQVSPDMGGVWRLVPGATDGWGDSIHPNWFGCSDYGPGTYTATIYDASAYDIGDVGDPDTDPYYDRVTVHFNLTP